MDASLKLYSYIASQCQMDKEGDPGIPGFVTISRQAGAGGITIGEKLANNLNKRLPGKCPWTVFDKNLVDEIIKENDLSEKIVPFLKEMPMSSIEDALENLLGLHPSQSTLVEKANHTVLHLARMGRAILVGRGAPVITKFTPGGIHVRLVGSLKIRKDHIKEYFHVTDTQAEDFIKSEDTGRAQYLKKYFDLDIDDPLLYDIVVNTDTVSYDEAALLIEEMVIRKIKFAKTAREGKN